MKKIIIATLIVIVQVSIALGYTTTIRAKGIGAIITNKPGNTVTIEATTSEITGWQVTEGNVNITNNQYITPESNIVIEAIEEGETPIEPEVPTEPSPYTIIVTNDGGAEIEGEYTNYSCSKCGGTDHECEVVNIIIEEDGAVVEPWGEDTTSPTTIILEDDGGAIIEGEYENYKCSECGGYDHECEVINIMIEEGNSSVIEI